MKKPVLSCFILLLALISCSPKQENKNKEQAAVSGNESGFGKTPYMLPSDMKVEILEKGSKVIFKGFAGEHPSRYSGISLVVYNGVDIYVPTENLSMLEVTMIRDDKIIDFDYCEYYNKDSIKVYKECNKESESFFVTKKELKFHKIQGIKDWLYLSADNSDDDNYGYIYVYDISEKSFYGNIEENMKSYNGYKMSLGSEYLITQRYKNIKRYGPLLAINHNNKTAEFWDSFSSFSYTIDKYLILEYYPKYNEVLIRVSHWEGVEEFIYNIESGYKCYTGIPYFNSSRTYMISLLMPYVESSLRIYSINNGLYTMLKEIELIDNELDEYIYNVNVVWLNDNNAQITLDNSGSMLIEIGKEVKITRK
jgi:hypothetical protein